MAAQGPLEFLPHAGADAVAVVEVALGLADGGLDGRIGDERDEEGEVVADGIQQATEATAQRAREGDVRRVGAVGVEQAVDPG
jgi:hypothetical protein